MREEDLRKYSCAYSDAVLRIAYTYLKSKEDAEDIAQETFLALMLSKKTYENDEHVKAWLLRVAINKCKNFLRSSWYTKRCEFNHTIISENENAQDFELLSAVLALPERYRVPIHLYYYEGYSIEEISKILGRNTATVGSQLARGRKKLHDMLGGDKLEK